MYLHRLYRESIMKKKIDIDNSIIYKSMSIEDLAEAIPCLEHNGYFSDTPDFSEYHYGELNEVYASHHHEYAFFGIGDSFETSFRYFAPESSIVFETVKRPYCYVEEVPFKLGETIALRSLSDKNTITEYKFTGYSIKLDDALGAIIDKITLVQVGNKYGTSVAPESLMDMFEIRINGEWQDMSVDA